jgi:hypothetical protein
MVGVVLGMMSYLAMVTGRISANGAIYMGTNTLAAILVAFSLIDHFNPATAVLQVFYTTVSAYGLWKVKRP